MRLLIALYFQMEILVRSLARMTIGALLGYIGWHIFAFGWGISSPMVFWFCLAIGGMFLVSAVHLLMNGLAGIVPRAHGYNPGRARTAGLADLLKAGIVRR